MKKPNITRGKWNNEVDVIYSDKEGLVADCSYIKGRDIDVINAKAIAAVPEMIDALIVAYLQIDDMPIGDRKERHLIVYNKLADALEMAGVEL